MGIPRFGRGQRMGRPQCGGRFGCAGQEKAGNPGRPSREESISGAGGRSSRPSARASALWTGPPASPPGSLPYKAGRQGGRCLGTAWQRRAETAEGEHRQTDERSGGTEAEGDAGDQADAGVDRLDARVTETVLEGGLDRREVGLDRLGEVDERGQAAAPGPGKPTAQHLQRPVVRELEDLAELLLEEVAAVQRAVGTSDVGQLASLPVAEIFGVPPQGPARWPPTGRGCPPGAPSSRIQGMREKVTKEHRGDRPIGLTPEEVDTLRKHTAAQAAERLRIGPMWQDHGLVFPSEIGTPMQARNLSRHFKALLKHAGLPDIRFHDLRHTAGTLLMREDSRVVIAQRRLGHKDPATTSRLYGHALPGDQRDAAGKVADVLRRASAARKAK